MFHVNGWGMHFAAAAFGVPQVVLRKVDGTEILRRMEQHDVTLMCGAPAVVASILDAAQTWQGPDTGIGQDPRRGSGRSAAADADYRTGRVRAWLGVRPDIRPYRGVSPADCESRQQADRRPLPPSNAPASSARQGRRPSVSRSRYQTRVRFSPVRTTSWPVTGTTQKQPTRR